MNHHSAKIFYAILGVLAALSIVGILWSCAGQVGGDMTPTPEATWTQTAITETKTATPMTTPGSSPPTATAMPSTPVPAINTTTPASIPTAMVVPSATPIPTMPETGHPQMAHDPSVTTILLFVALTIILIGAWANGRRWQ